MVQGPEWSFGMLVAVSAPSALAIDLENGEYDAQFARQDSMNLYAGRIDK